MSEPQYTNRLIHESSPYLLQHAHNPVDWYPWGDEAFQKAKAEDKPLLLSCGYSSCHWCHVMERESFEDPEIAKLMNDFFINIKVDREERPDIDQIYQHAVQIITGQGGWPLTVFIDHERKPFFGGTYFPPAPMYGRASFPQILQVIHEKWVNGRKEIFEAGKEISDYLQPTAFKLDGKQNIPEQELPIRASNQLVQAADQRYGGFGMAPKFPNPSLLQLLVKVGTIHQQTSAVEHIIFTLRQMAKGGIYDQIGGGFHRYSTDQHWLVPHFEKMLYDNAQLLQMYTVGYQLTGDEEFRAVVRDTADYIRREMTAPEGGFYATQDADSEGVEGKFFLWDLAEVEKVLKPEEVQIIRDYYRLTKEGNFEGKNILNRLKEPGGVFESSNLPPEIWETLIRAKEKLLKVREERVKPFRDEKIIASWNGLMIGALAYSYQVFQRQEDYQSARRAAEFILGSVRSADGSLCRIYKDGKARINAFLDDYAFLAQGLIDLYEADFDEIWLSKSLDLTEKILAMFSSGEGQYFLVAESNNLYTKPLSGRDQAIPSGVSIHCENLLRLAAFTGKAELWSEAEKILTAYGHEMRQDSWSHAGLIGVLDLYYQGFKEFTFISEEAALPEILVKLRKSYIPYRILVWRNNLAESLASHPAKELLQGRGTVDGKPTCYICLNYNCLPPVTNWEEIQPLANPFIKSS